MEAGDFVLLGIPGILFAIMVLGVVFGAGYSQAQCDVKRLRQELNEARRRLLTAAGDDLCRLTQEEIKAMGLGQIQIPPKGEFLASCERFHAQVAGDAGVNTNCLTLAQLVAENEMLRQQIAQADVARRAE